MKDEAAAEIKQGTSLEVLQAYPLGTLPVTFATAPHMGVIGNIDALRAQIGNQEAAAYLQTDERGLASHWAPVSKFLPYLKPFAALCTPLADGTIPAVEVAKMIFHAEKCCDWKNATASLIHIADINRVDVRIPDTRPAHFPGTKSFWEDWDGVNLQAIDYLRSQHFALPVNGRPLLEGIDYLVKEAGK